MIEKWLQTYGIEYDPFHELDAGADKRLGEYLIGKEEFDLISQPAPSLVFADAGGGKSAFRVWLASACRAGLWGGRVFPIVYRLPMLVMRAPAAERRQSYVDSIAEAATRELLLYLAYHPQRFLHLSSGEQGLLAALLDRHLPTDRAYYASQARTPKTLHRLTAGYDPTARWLNPPDEQSLRAFWAAMLAAQPPAGAAHSADLASWSDVLRRVLQFGAVYLLLDGVDAYPGTQASPRQVVALLHPLWELARRWSKHAVFLKAFLPLELQSVSALRNLTPAPSVAIIEWTESALNELIERRLSAAGGMAEDSLDRLGSVDVGNVQLPLVRAALTRSPLPRSLVHLVERLFYEHVSRAGPAGPITAADLERTLAWFRRRHPAKSANRTVA